jgi:hypothetical protein
VLLTRLSVEVADQLVRETGSIQAKAGWEVQTTAREFLGAAALGSEPQGVLTASLDPGGALRFAEAGSEDFLARSGTPIPHGRADQ